MIPLVLSAVVGALFGWVGSTLRKRGRLVALGVIVACAIAGVFVLTFAVERGAVLSAVFAASHVVAYLAFGVAPIGGGQREVPAGRE